MRSLLLVAAVVFASACDPIRNRVDDKLLDSVPPSDRSGVSQTQEAQKEALANQGAADRGVVNAQQSANASTDARVAVEKSLNASKARERWETQKVELGRIQAEVSKQRAVLADAVNEREKARVVKSKGVKPDLDLSPFEAAVPDQERRLADLEVKEAKERAEAKRLESELRWAEGGH
jgi:hypothetical protein